MIKKNVYFVIKNPIQNLAETLFKLHNYYKFSDFPDSWGPYVDNNLNLSSWTHLLCKFLSVNVLCNVCDFVSVNSVSWGPCCYEVQGSGKDHSDSTCSESAKLTELDQWLHSLGRGLESTARKMRLWGMKAHYLIHILSTPPIYLA